MQELSNFSYEDDLNYLLQELGFEKEANLSCEYGVCSVWVYNGIIWFMN